MMTTVYGGAVYVLSSEWGGISADVPVDEVTCDDYVVGGGTFVYGVLAVGHALLVSACGALVAVDNAAVVVLGRGGCNRHWFACGRCEAPA